LAASAASLSGTAGCLGGTFGGGDGGDGGDGSEDGDGEGSGLTVTPTDGNVDGYPPEFDDQPAKRDVDTSSFGTVPRNGVQVPLAPIDVVHYWYRRGEARIADARGQRQYEASHVYGAVLSQASPEARSSADPVTDWPKDDRIVCYCGCPHHLSSIRAAQLMNNGYENVYVIDEGFWTWHDRGYPMRGNEVSATSKNWVIDGEAAAASAGADAWARHRPTGQVEATGIADDGSYQLHVKFHEVGPDSTVQVETPDYRVEGKLKDLASGTVRG